MFLRFKKILQILFFAALTTYPVNCQSSDLSSESAISESAMSEEMFKEAQKEDSTESHSDFKKKSSIKSIYVGRCSDFQRVCKTLDRYGANAVVIDVKDDFGRLFPGLPVPYNAKNRFMPRKSFKNLLKKLKEKKIYTIARVVALKEFTRDDLCIRGKDGAVKIDREKTSWMDPRNEKVLQYLEEICTAAVKIGFDEVQLDYVRFSSYFRDDAMNTDFRQDVKGNAGQKSIEKDGAENQLKNAKNQLKKSIKNNSTDKARIDAINNLMDRITVAVHDLGGKVSVCVFGCTINGSIDTPRKKNQTQKSSEILGQDYVELAERVDYICPMIYPSHYPKNTPCGIKDPDLEPYKTVDVCMKLSSVMLETAQKKHLKAKIRPYLQAFTARWLKNHLRYGKKEIDDQIRAVQDSGSADQWGLFHMAGRYP